jgi:hypothetical protein
MPWLIAGLVLLLALGAYAILTPLRLRGEGRAGSDLAAEGVFSAEWGPFGIRLERTGADACMALLVRRRAIIKRALGKGVSPAPTAPKSRSSLRGLRRRIDAADAVHFIVAQRRHIRLDLLEGHLLFGFADPALTGQIYGFLSALRGTLPRLTTGLGVQAEWSGVERFDIQGCIALRLFVGRIALASLFVLAQLARSQPVPGSEADR